MPEPTDDRSRYRAPVGTHDVLPPESAQWTAVVTNFATRAGRYGFDLVITPVFEHLDDLAEEPTWLGIGYITADAGGLLLLIALILGGVGLRRSRKGGGNGLLKATGVLATLLVAVYVVAVWAMGGKPT